MSFDLVLFGGTGDLTWRKLMPALFQAYRHGKLPPEGRILAVARDERSDDEYRAFIKERFSDVDPGKRPSDDEFAQFAQMLHYRRMDLSQPAHYAGLKDWVDARGAKTVVLFLATSPHLFPVICEQLGNAALNGPHVRVVLEKPLGHGPGQRARNQPRRQRRVQRITSPAHRPLLGQTSGAKPDGAALWQRPV
jgi:glucose-6-phosphate 1-dehydrogenase